MNVCENTGHPEPTDEWVRIQWCHVCQWDTDFEFKLWVDEGLVTEECLSCGTVSDYEDSL